MFWVVNKDKILQTSKKLNRFRFKATKIKAIYQNMRTELDKWNFETKS